MFPVVNMLWVFHDPLFDIRCMYLIAAFPAANSFVFTCFRQPPTATLNNASMVARHTKQRHPDVLPSCTFLARIDEVYDAVRSCGGWNSDSKTELEDFSCGGKLQRVYFAHSGTLDMKAVMFVFVSD